MTKKLILYALIMLPCFYFCKTAGAAEPGKSSSSILLFRDITGTVRDTSGKVLMGVSVMIKGNNVRGTMTDMNGRLV